MHRPIAVLSALALAALVVAPALPARADTTISASTFATSTNFCGGGTFTINGSVEVKGGSATIADNCFGTLANGARIRFTNVNLTFNGQFVVLDGANSRLEVDDSTMRAALALSLFPGTARDRHPVNGAQITVKGSSLFGGTGVGVVASCDGNNGIVDMEDSRLSSSGALGVLIAASDHTAIIEAPSGTCHGVSGGQVTVRNNRIDAGGNQRVAISSTARTEARANTFNPADIRLIHSDGECRSESNIPTTPCS